jgi:hypothetical protein
MDYEQTEEHAIRSHNVVSRSEKPVSKAVEHVSGEADCRKGSSREDGNCSGAICKCAPCKWRKLC